MGIIFSVGAFILATLILSSMQLNPSVFMIFYHYTYGKNTQKTASRLSVYYIFGSLMAVGLLLIATFYLTIDSGILRWILAGILFAVGIVYGLFYFQKGRHTKLFLTRRMANSILKTAENVRKPSDAFMLGAMTKIPELVFCLPIYLVLALAIGGFSDAIMRTSLGIVVILASILPLLIAWGFYKGGRNLAEMQRLRVKNKQFLRFFTLSCYFLIVALLISAEIWR